MENIIGYASSAVLVAGGWDLVNGILHDVFVLRSEHGKQYDRNLLRLLMDGHVLMTCGFVLLLISIGVRSGHQYAYSVAAVTLVSMIVYCFMIFPFLKSLVTLFINSVALIIIILSLLKK